MARPRRYTRSINLLVTPFQRAALEIIAEEEGLSLAEAGRMVIDIGINYHAGFRAKSVDLDSGDELVDDPAV